MRLIALLFLALCPSLFAAPPPNLLLVMVDDMGFSDLGCYGSEIETPHLDKLAANGVRFTQFYNTAKCHSSRVSLLCGRWCRQAGDESLRRAAIIPCVLEFKLQSHATGPAELYWTTDAATILRKGKHQDFDVKHDGQWHEHTLRIDETKTLHALRLDPCGGEGEVRIKGLVLKDAEGKVLKKWP